MFVTIIIIIMNAIIFNIITGPSRGEAEGLLFVQIVFRLYFTSLKVFVQQNRSAERAESSPRTTVYFAILTEVILV